MKIYEHPTRSGALGASIDVKVRANDGDRPIIKYLGSDASEDRYGSILDPKGWQLEAFRRNPVILWAHDYSRPPIGRALDVQVTSRGLEFTVEFASQVNAFAREVYELVRGGFCSGVSVGFLPIEAEKYKSATVPNGENLRYTKQELLELSVVPVPANRASLQNAYATGRVRESTLIMAGRGFRGFINGRDLFRMRPPVPEWEPSADTIRRLEAVVARGSRGRRY